MQLERLAALRAKIFRTARVETERLYLRQIVAQRLANFIPHFTFPLVRTTILRAGGLHVGTNSLVLGELTISGPGNWRELITVGDNTMITGPLAIDLGAPVHIGNLVRIGHQVLLLTVDHEIGPDYLRCGPHSFAPIRIGDGAWLASRVTVLPGVTIGDGAVVAAGSVVVRDVPPNVLVAGVPAKVIRSLDPNEPRAAVDGAR
jgi:acetyltransferase-like isoleucine patch superfamily enzyme